MEADKSKSKESPFHLTRVAARKICDDFLRFSSDSGDGGTVTEKSSGYDSKSQQVPESALLDGKSAERIIAYTIVAAKSWNEEKENYYNFYNLARLLKCPYTGGTTNEQAEACARSLISKLSERHLNILIEVLTKLELDTIHFLSNNSNTMPKRIHAFRGNSILTYIWKHLRLTQSETLIQQKINPIMQQFQKKINQIIADSEKKTDQDPNLSLNPKNLFDEKKVDQHTNPSLNPKNLPDEEKTAFKTLFMGFVNELFNIEAENLKKYPNFVRLICHSIYRELKEKGIEESESARFIALSFLVFRFIIGLVMNYATDVRQTNDSAVEFENNVLIYNIATPLTFIAGHNPKEYRQLYNNYKKHIKTVFFSENTPDREITAFIAFNANYIRAFVEEIMTPCIDEIASVHADRLIKIVNTILHFGQIPENRSKLFTIKEHESNRPNETTLNEINEFFDAIVSNSGPNWQVSEGYNSDTITPTRGLG